MAGARDVATIKRYERLSTEFSNARKGAFLSVGCDALASLSVSQRLSVSLSLTLSLCPRLSRWSYVEADGMPLRCAQRSGC